MTVCGLAVAITAFGPSLGQAASSDGGCSSSQLLLGLCISWAKRDPSYCRAAGRDGWRCDTLLLAQSYGFVSLLGTVALPAARAGAATFCSRTKGLPCSQACRSFVLSRCRPQGLALRHTASCAIVRSRFSPWDRFFMLLSRRRPWRLALRKAGARLLVSRAHFDAEGHLGARCLLVLEP